jgi:hypothetical protein
MINIAYLAHKDIFYQQKQTHVKNNVHIDIMHQQQLKNVNNVFLLAINV